MGQTPVPSTVHPSVAPSATPPTTNTATNPTVTPPLLHPATSPTLNFGDGAWNHGESALAATAADVGGIRATAAPANYVAHLSGPNQNVHRFVPSGSGSGWNFFPASAGNPAYWQFRGYLRPAGVPLPTGVPVGSPPGTPAQPIVDDAGFDVICADVYVPSLPDMIVITTPPTLGDALDSGTAPDIGVRFAYPGWEDPTGAGLGPTTALALRGLLFENERVGAPKSHNLIIAQINPRLLGTPGAFQIQRNLELVRAVRAMFQQDALLQQDADKSWWPGTTGTGWQLRTLPTGVIPAVICGGSFGGGVAYWSMLFFPEDFQAAVSSGGPPSPRRYAGEQESLRYLMSLSGFGACGKEIGTAPRLHWNAMWSQIANARSWPATGPSAFSPFYHASALVAARDGYLKRPLLLIMNDEETVSTCNDWQPVLSGQRAFVPFGTKIFPGSPEIFWASAGKRCHGDEPYELPCPFAVGHVHGTWFPLIVEFLQRLPSLPSYSATVTFSPPTSIVNASEDPYEHVFMPVVPSPTLPSPAPLRLDPAFSGTTGQSLQATVPLAAQRPGKSFGSGTYLGFGDSMILGAPYQTDESYTGAHEIFVGSAEGVVTRFAVAATGEMVPQAMSEALGYGAWALALGEADGAPGKEVIVGTHRGLFTLYREGLDLLGAKRNLDWELGRPLHLCVADVIPGGRSEVIMACEGGQLAAFALDDLSNATQPLATYFEPGVVDIKVLNPTGNPVELLLLSDRGHVSRVSWNIPLPGTGTPTMTLLATSPRLNGIPRDLELMPDGGSVAVLLSDTKAAHRECIWVLDRTTLDDIDFVLTGLSDTMLRVNPAAGPGIDLEVLPDDKGFLVLRHDRLLIVPYPASTVRPAIELCSFQPMMRALDLAIGRVFDQSVDEQPALLVATETGYVCWASLADVLSTTLAQLFQPTSPPGSEPGANLWPFSTAPTTPPQPGAPTGGFRRHGLGNAAPMHCNRSLAATWGMVVSGTELRVLDQSGTMWAVDAAGNVRLVQEVSGTRPIGGAVYQHMPLAGPFRGLATAIAPNSSTAAGSAVSAASPLLQNAQLAAGLALGTSRDFESNPFVPSQPVQNLGTAVDWVRNGPNRHFLPFYGPNVAFPRGGDVLRLVASNQYVVCWWSGQEHQGMFGNRVQGLRIDGASGTVDQWWTSVAPTTNPSGDTVASSLMAGMDLRAYHTESWADRHAQALRLFSEPSDPLEVRCAVLTPGARLMVLRPGVGGGSTPPAALGPKELDSNGNLLDFGTGGMALAVAPPRAGVVDLYVGSVSFFADNTQFTTTPQTPAIKADDMVSAISAVTWNGSSGFAGAQLTRSNASPIVLDGVAGRPKVYGVCGMVVGDLIAGNPGQELVVGALDGHLLVCGLDPATGAILMPPLYQTQVEGAVGAYNSLIVADLDGDGHQELYAAGSLGLRRWIFQ